MSAPSDSASVGKEEDFQLKMFPNPSNKMFVVVVSPIFYFLYEVNSRYDELQHLNLNNVTDLSWRRNRYPWAKSRKKPYKKQGWNTSYAI